MGDSLPVPLHGKQPRTVLLVEDELVVRMDVSQQLRSTGFTVIEAVNGQEALDVLHSSLRVDIVVTDLHMPRVDGAALVREIRSRFAHLPVFMIAGQLPAEDVYKMLDGFFSKPFNIAVFTNFLQTMFRDESLPGR